MGGELEVDLVIRTWKTKHRKIKIIHHRRNMSRARKG